ncbi:MAG: hypothetical protein M1820_008963 [Bogoriella megaspora]|nr:MAG: hypothetical protein M1820_008963 [Bogoriella megaspora]
MSSPGPATEALGRIAFHLSEMQPFLPMYIHLILSALFPIFAGAHASLSRPSSAAAPSKKSRKDKDIEEEEAEEEEHGQTRMEGLSPSDAIMFPLLAGATLSGLYLLIKWLQDAALLNKILNWYFSGFGVFSLGRLATDCLIFGKSLVFPRIYSHGGKLWRVNGAERRVTVYTGGAEDKNTASPLPGAFSRLRLPAPVNSLLWTIRTQLSQKLLIKIHAKRIARGKLTIGYFGIVGTFIGLICVLYFNFVSRPWFLTNILGFAFSYSALQFMSPTTFGTGSLILGALFLYDIYFVFYTPMMVTVAKELDVPIKLLFPRPAPEGAPADQTNMSMLGLGDIVLPGIMIGLALRFDLYMFYLKKQRERPPKSTTPPFEKNSDRVEMSDSGNRTEIQKAPYEPVTGRWGERFWCHSLSSMLMPNFAKSKAQIRAADEIKLASVASGAFPKPYFYASIIGYVTGMCVTLAVMQVANHAQPALLYLVPGVLGSVWLTGFIRGEVCEMWKYDETTAEEEAGKVGKGDGKEQKKQEDRKESKKSFFSQGTREKQADAIGKSMGKYIAQDDESEDEAHEPNSLPEANGKAGDTSSIHETKRKDFFSRDRSNELFFLSVSLQHPSADRKISSSMASNDALRRTSRTKDADLEKDDTSELDIPRVQRRSTNGEPSGKRLRVS